MARLSRFSADEKRILLFTCPLHFFCHFFILVFPAVTMPLVNSLGMPLEDVVKISFLMYLCYGLFALPVGLLVDRWQAKRMLLLGLDLMGVGLILAGLFPQPTVMYFSLAIVGIGASVYHPAGMALITRTVKQRGYALGVNGVYGNLGIAGAPLVTGILTWLIGWQAAFIVLGVSGVVTAVLLSLIRIDESIEPDARRSTHEGTHMVKYFLIVSVGLVFSGIAYRGNMLLLPAYIELNTDFFAKIVESLSFIKPQGMSTLAATVLTSIVLLGGMFGQMLGGRLADRMDLRRGYLLIHAASLPFILGMAYTTNYLLAVCAALYVMFSLGMQPIENSLIASLTPHRWRSTSFALKFILNFGVGSLVIYLIGPIKEAFSLSTVYVFLAGVTALLVATVAALNIASRHVASVRN